MDVNLYFIHICVVWFGVHLGFHCFGYICISIALKEEFKSLPNLIQGALNATNICFEAVGEVELLSTIALRAQQMLHDQQVPDFGKIAQMSAAGAVGLYANTLGKFVQYYGGGPPGFITIRYLSACSVQDKTLILGKEFFTAIVEAEFSSMQLFPLTRVAFAVCNLTAPRSRAQDGFSRLLTRTDIQTLKSKKNMPLLTEMESNFELGWAKVTQHPDESIAFKIFGKLQVRSLLHILKKSKHGHEDRGYNSLKEILDLFEAELQSQQVASAQAVSASSGSAAGAQQKAMDLDQAKDPMFLAQMKLELKTGSLVLHKQYAGKIFTVQKCDHNGVQLEYKDQITGYMEVVDVKPQDVISMIKNTKAKMPGVMPNQELEMAFANIRCEAEITKCHAYVALMDMYNALDVDSSSIQVLGMSRIFAQADFKKGELQFIPITSSASLLSVTKPASAAPHPIWKNIQLYINPPKTYKEGKPQESGIVVPFFIVKHDDEEGNMDFQMIEYQGLKVLGMVNNTNIKKNDEILCKGKLKDYGTVAPKAEAKGKKRKSTK